MAEHYVEKCSCGQVISQCRCLSDAKTVRVIPDGCKDCQGKSGTIAVFQQERDLGLADRVRTTASVQYHGELLPGPSLLEQRPDLSEFRSQAGNLSLDDLFPVDSILVSTGLNLNDDWFDKNETYAARHTPADKPLNHEHESIQVIGHMLAAQVVDSDRKTVAEGDPVPDRFHIVNSAVLYRHWPGYPERQAMVDRIIAELENPPAEGAWCVSMECRFRGFDYVLIPYDGHSLATAQAKVVERNESTAYLTKHLRAYGGAGQFQGYKVGRVLRNITFSGVGLVRVPANPDSVILHAGDPAGLGVASEKISVFPNTSGYVQDSHACGHDQHEYDMTVEVLTKQVEDLKAQLAEAHKTVDAAKSAESTAKIQELTSQLDAAKAELTQAQAEKTALEAAKSEADKTIASLTERAETAEAELKTLSETIAQAKAEQAKAERIAQVQDAYGLDTAEAATKAATPLLGLSDEAFAAHLATIAEYKTKQKPAHPATEALKTATETNTTATVVVTDTESTKAAEYEALSKELLGFFGKTKK